MSIFSGISWSLNPDREWGFLMQWNNNVHNIEVQKQCTILETQAGLKSANSEPIPHLEWNTYVWLCTAMSYNCFFVFFKNAPHCSLLIKVGNYAMTNNLFMNNRYEIEYNGFCTDNSIAILSIVVELLHIWWFGCFQLSCWVALHHIIMCSFMHKIAIDICLK
jgi:hypothetical protein